MHRRGARQHQHRPRAGLATVALALLCLAGLCFAALPARASTDAAAAATAAGASSDLPAASGSAAGAGAGMAGAAGTVAGGGSVGKPTAGAMPAELNAATLAPALGALPPGAPVLLEFYAHWCPTCRRFQPEYEKAAAGLAAKGSHIFVARLDCADEAKLCAAYGVQRFPTMIVGTAADVAGLAKSAWVTYSGALTGEAVEGWAASTALGLVGAGGAAGGGAGSTAATSTTATAADLQRQHAAEVASSPPPPPIPAMLPTSARPGGRSDVGDILKATSLTFQYALQAEATHGEPGAREAFAAWAGLVAAAHPVAACRAGAAALVAGLPKTWPAAAPSSLGPPPTPDPSLAATPICGPATPIPAVWDGCAPSRDASGRVSTSGRRGYTCGLWQTFHALAAGLPEDGDGGVAGGQSWMDGVRGYVKHFFQCSECAAHFTEMASAGDAAAVKTRSDAVLWAWRAHNRVNARLAVTEAATPGDGDPAHPKLPWPTRALCPACSAPAPGPDDQPQWNEAAVADFLVRWYRAEDDGKGGGGRKGGGAVLPRRALGDGGTTSSSSSEGSRPLLILAVVGLVCAAVVAATRPPPARRGAKAAAH